MSKFPSNAATNKVVSLNGLGRDRSPGQRILGECRDQLVNSLSLWLCDVAKPISEELFVLADSTRERLQQTRYLDLRADIEKDWPHLVETFRRDLSAEAERCQNQGTQKEQGQETPLELPDFEGLQLLADDDLSEHIVIREFAAQISETCDDELYTLNRRIAALLGRDDQIDSTHPLSPPIVCRALSDACAAIGSSAPERLILLRRLERHLHLGLPPIYQKINAYLIDRGILPDFKRSYRKSAVLGEARTSQTVDQTAGGTIATSGSNTVLPLAGEGILEALQRLAQARTAPPSGMSSAAVSGNGILTSTGGHSNTSPSNAAVSGPVLDTNTINQLLLASLNEMQRTAIPSGEDAGLIINQIRRVRDSESAQQVGGLAAVTIDIVAMLFDFIFDNPDIPVAIKALISRLQIPVLKVAMLNPGFFSDRQHPTRRFLGSVSGISIRWGSSVDETDPFYGKLAELVERIQTGFEDDIEIFGTALAELDAFVSENEGKEDSTALTAANIVILHEQETTGWERAQHAVRTFSAANPLPILIDSFLQEHWVSVLQALAINNDENSDEWLEAIETMKDLAWSIGAKKSPDDRLKLISLLPKLLGRLNTGLDRIDAAPTQRHEFFDALVICHSAALKGEKRNDPLAETQPPVVAPSFSPPEEGDLLVTRSVDNGIEVEEIMLIGASPIWRADDREIFHQVSALKRGDWVEFHDETGASNRARLHWISPQRGILLFSNHRSAKAISIAPEALARQIRDGKASIVSETEHFERALTGALESINAS